MRKECSELIQQLEFIKKVLLEGRPVDPKFFPEGIFDNLVLLAKNCNCISKELLNRISDLSSILETHPHELASKVQDLLDIISRDCGKANEIVK